VQVERWDRTQVEQLGTNADLARRLRSGIPTGASVADAVREIVASVRNDGDRAVLEATMRLDTKGAKPKPLVVESERLDAALEALPLEVVAGLQVAIANVASVAQLAVHGDASLRLPQGHTVKLRELPVQAAAVYVPGGRAAYPSTAVMGVVTARAAGVLDVAVCSPPGADGEVQQAILAACGLLGVKRVYRMGGAQAIAALAYGSESVNRVDVVVGPGNLYVQEAKRQLSRLIGIDGFAGPSDLMVLAGADADAELLALDMLAQAEHGEGSIVIAASDSRQLLDRLAERLANLADDHGGLAKCALVELASVEQGVELANAFAPEHLQLVGAQPEGLAGRVRCAGCLLVGAASATAFGDYVAGSNHVLPTSGAARFSSALSPRHFRRTMPEVRIDSAAAAKLAKAGAPVAQAEGFRWHARSMQARAGETSEDAVSENGA
jgi:histidinol dehydrogenase